MQVDVLSDPDVTWYGPHACDGCGETIIRAALERGGQKFNVPADLLRVFHRGAEASQYFLAYPKVWTPHACAAQAPVGAEVAVRPHTAPAVPCVAPSEEAGDIGAIDWHTRFSALIQEALTKHCGAGTDLGLAWLARRCAEDVDDLYVRAFRHGAQWQQDQPVAVHLCHACENPAYVGMACLWCGKADLTRVEPLKTSPRPRAGSTAATDQG